MRPKICKDNGVNIPTSDCSTCEILEQKVDALTEELENKQDILTAGDHIVIDEDVISANLDDYYDKVDVDTMINGISSVRFLVVDELPEEGDGRTIYLLSNGSGYDQYVYTNDTWTSIGSTSTENVLNVYPRTGETELSANWLSLTDGGTAITPSTGMIYILVKGSEHVGAGDILRWNGSEYKVISDGGVTKGSYDADGKATLKWEGGRLNPTQNIYLLKLGSDGKLASYEGTTPLAEYATTSDVQTVSSRIPTSISNWSGTVNIPTSQTWYPDGISQTLAFTALNSCTFIGSATVTFNANATGDRQVGVTLNGTTGFGAGMKVRATTSGVTVVSIPIIVRMAANDHLRLEMWQNSGSTLGATAQMHGIFIYD